ncbi:MAG: hypothetical protein J6D21_03175 [Clostridia bacterium]|nr:hypothetical protein [Clostridia bacterium]
MALLNNIVYHILRGISTGLLDFLCTPVYFFAFFCDCAQLFYSFVGFRQIAQELLVIFVNIFMLLGVVIFGNIW